MIPSLKELSLGMSLSKRLFRFAGVGALSSLVYVLAVALYVELLGIEPGWASALAYVTAIPVSFFGHRKVTFRSDASLLPELLRFLLIHATNIAISVGGMAWAVNWLGASYWVGSLIAVVLVPLSTFIIMDLWVFSRRGT